MVIVRWGMHLGVMDARILVYPLLSLAKRSDWSRRKFSCEGGGGRINLTVRQTCRGRYLTQTLEYEYEYEYETPTILLIH